jgi:hypothetical protein
MKRETIKVFCRRVKRGRSLLKIAKRSNSAEASSQVLLYLYKKATRMTSPSLSTIEADSSSSWVRQSTRSLPNLEAR